MQTYTSRILNAYPAAALRRVPPMGPRFENGSETAREGDCERRAPAGRRAERHLPAVVDERAHFGEQCQMRVDVSPPRDAIGSMNAVAIPNDRS